MIPAPLAPTPALPELVTVPCPTGCEQGHIIRFEGTPYECYPKCESCLGNGTVELCRGCDEPYRVIEGREVCACEVNCETCDRRVPLGDIVDAGVCRTCFAKGEKEAEEDPEYAVWKTEQLNFGREVGWL